MENERMPDSPIDLTVSIVNWNAGNFILACLESIFSTIENVSFEVLLVDNCSTDDSLRLVREAYPQVSILQNPSNEGYARGQNRILRHLRSRYVLLLNPDCEVSSGTIDHMVDLLDVRPDVGLVACRVLSRDGKPQRTVVSLPSVRSAFRNSIEDFFWPFSRFFNGKSSQREGHIHLDGAGEPVEVEALGGPFLLAREAMIRDVGLLEEAFFLFSEENDWCVRISKMGWKILYAPREIVFHGLGKCREKASSAFSVYHFYRSRLLYFRKHHGLFQAMVVSVIYGLFGTWAVLLGSAKRLILGRRERGVFLSNALATCRAVSDVWKAGWRLDSTCERVGRCK